MTTAGSATSGEKGHRLEEKIKELKLKDLALREDRNKERERRKEVEHQLKAAQKERYIQGTCTLRAGTGQDFFLLTAHGVACRVEGEVPGDEAGEGRGQQV